MEIKRFDDFIICPIPAESELDQVEIEKIVAHTRNTWQHDRQNGEMRENTIQGKRAEIVIENILNDNSTSRFLAYDKIRRDNFNKHAPFDGIIYRKDISANILQSAIDKVNNDVINSGGNTGIITVDTRKYMERNSIYTIEIKSSLLRYPRDYRCINGDVEVTRSNDNYIRLCEYVKNYYDYFVYPHFCRDNQNITSFYDYTRYVRDINNIIKSILTGTMISEGEYSKKIKGNLKYYVTDFVDKESDELTNELLEHIVEMIQLEYGVSINNSQYIMVIDDDEMDELEENFNYYKDLKAVFLSQDVLLSTSQERILQNVNTFIIPDYYFDTELREAGELW